MTILELKDKKQS